MAAPPFVPVTAKEALTFPGEPWFKVCLFIDRRLTFDDEGTSAAVELCEGGIADIECEGVI